MLEVDGNNAQEARNVYGINLIARSAESTSLYYMYNGHADVVALLDINCIILAQYYYDAFGNILEQLGEADNPIRYAGYQYDEETSLYYLNARYYDSKIARFISEDTYRGDANDPLSLNLYTYCFSNPIRYWDPTGHRAQGELIKIGAKGNDVTTIQEALIKAGYDLGSWGADGSFGNATLNAVKAFQTANGLACDGIVGDLTWAALYPTIKLPEEIAIKKASNLLNVRAVTDANTNSTKKEENTNVTEKNTKSYGSLDSASNQWLPVNPAVTSSPDNRTPESYSQVVDQFDVENSKRYDQQQDGKITWCNIFAWDVTSAMGAEIPHWVYSDGRPAEPCAIGSHEMNANEVAKWLKEKGEKYGRIFACTY